MNTGSITLHLGHIAAYEAMTECGYMSSGKDIGEGEFNVVFDFMSDPTVDDETGCEYAVFAAKAIDRNPDEGCAPFTVMCNGYLLIGAFSRVRFMQTVHVEIEDYNPPDLAKQFIDAIRIDYHMMED